MVLTMGYSTKKRVAPSKPAMAPPSGCPSPDEGPHIRFRVAQGASRPTTGQLAHFGFQFYQTKRSRRAREMANRL